MRNLLLLITLIVFLPGWALAQRGDYKPKFNKSRKVAKEPFPSAIEFRPGGWYLGAGLTGTMGFSDRTSEQTVNNTTYTLETSPGIGPWFLLEAGRFYNFKKGKIFKYADFGLAYKGIRSSESFRFTQAAQDNAFQEEGDHNFTQHYISLNANINNIIPITDYNFIQNSIGINADVRFLEDFDSQYPFPGVPTNNPGSFVAQVHYKLGFGYTYDTDRVLLVSLETPIFNLTPQQQNFSQLDFFNSSYQTFILRVRLYLFRLADTTCPPVNSDQPPGFKNGYGNDY